MNNKRFFAVVVLACLAMLAQPAIAAKGFKYSYAEVGYRNVSGDAVEGDGFRGFLSYAATDYFNVVLEYSRLFVDDVKRVGHFKKPNKVDLDLDEFKFGIGGHYPVRENVDLTLTAVFVNDEYSGFVTPVGSVNKSRVSDTSSGYEVEFGARVRLHKKFEIIPHITYKDVGQDTNAGGGVGIVYKFYKKFSVRANSTFYSDDSEVNLFAGVRLDL